MIAKRKWLYGLELCVFGFLIVVNFMGCAGSRTAVEPKDVRVFIEDARDSIALAQEAGAGELAPEEIARAESLVARAEEAAKEEKPGIEPIRFASEAKTKAEVAYAVSRQAMAHEKEMERLSADRTQEIAALRAAQKIARENEKEKAGEVEEYKWKIEQLQKEKDREVAMVRSALRDAEAESDSMERELAEATSDSEAAKEKLEEILLHSEKAQRIEREKDRELNAIRDALNEAESDARRAEAKVKAYSEKIADMERRQEKEIAVHVARKADSQKKAAKAQVRKETLRGKPSLEALEEVTKALEGWRVAWQTKDLDSYMSYYADHAKITKALVAQGKEDARELDKREMRYEMEDFFAQNVRYNMEKPVLEAGSDAVRATFEFFKQVPAEAYENRKGILKHDKWIKELLFREVQRNWKIVEENWRLYQSIPEYAERW